MKENGMEIAKRLKELRKRNQTTVYELSEMFSKADYPVSVKTIYKWECGKVMPDIKILSLLTYFFNTTMSYFVDDCKKIQALSDSELEFLTTIREDSIYKKVITIIAKNKKEGVANEYGIGG